MEGIWFRGRNGEGNWLLCLASKNEAKSEEMGLVASSQWNNLAREKVETEGRKEGKMDKGNGNYSKIWTNFKQWIFPRQMGIRAEKII